MNSVTLSEGCYFYSAKVYHGNSESHTYLSGVVSIDGGIKYAEFMDYVLRDASKIHGRDLARSGLFMLAFNRVDGAVPAPKKQTGE